MRVLFTIMLLAWSIVSFGAEQPVFIWSPPTTFADGSTLNPSVDIAEYRLYCSPDIGSQVIDTVSAGTEAPYSWKPSSQVFPVGQFDCSMTAVSTTIHGGLESVKSNLVVVTVDPSAPSPVIILEVQ